MKSSNDGKYLLLFFFFILVLLFICPFKGRFLVYRRYHDFANLFSKLSKALFLQEISKFQ